ncbi:MAG: hypothetical protein ACJZ59_00520 [Candidatus Thalassarchaeaceae archaeon]
MAIRNDKKGSIGNTIQLTVASTTDQTQKVRVEVPPRYLCDGCCP